MPPTTGITQQLIEVRLGCPLVEYVEKARAQGDGWRRIARALSAKTGVPVSYESLRSWCGDRPAA